jgi:hypothetical protein
MIEIKGKGASSERVEMWNASTRAGGDEGARTTSGGWMCVCVSTPRIPGRVRTFVPEVMVAGVESESS